LEKILVHLGKRVEALKRFPSVDAVCAAGLAHRNRPRRRAARARRSAATKERRGSKLDEGDREKIGTGKKNALQSPLCRDHYRARRPMSDPGGKPAKDTVSNETQRRADDAALKVHENAKPFGANLRFEILTRLHKETAALDALFDAESLR